MEKHTLKELKKIASEKKIRGRSKMNKAQLYDVLSDVINQLGGMKLESQDENIEDYLVEKIEKMSLEEEDFNSPPSNPFGPKPYMTVHKYYDYVVAECPSTSEAFPVLVDNPEGGEGALKWNDFMYHFFGYTHEHEGIWVTTEHIQGPIGLKSDFNSPMNIEFERYTTKGGKRKLASATITPIVDPETAGYKDIMDKYGTYDVNEGSYYIEKSGVIGFCKEIIERSSCWDYIPDFVLDLEKALKSRGIGFSNKIIFVDVRCSELEDLQEVLFDYPDYNDCRITQCKRFETSEGLYVLYLKLE